MKLARIAFILILALLPLSCGGAHRADQQAATPRLHSGEVTIGEALAELDALQTPDGVDAATFGELKQAMRSYLQHTSTTKFTVRAPEGANNAVDDLTMAFTEQGEPGIQWNYRNIGDYNFDGEVNISDLTPLGAYLGASEAESSIFLWDKARFVDGDGNGEVNISDITPIGAHIYSQINEWAIEAADSPDGPFTPIQVVELRGLESAQLPNKMVTYVVIPAVQKPYYRVAPQDAQLNRGEFSNVSVQFIISDETRIIGDPGMPTYASRNVNEILLNDSAGGEPFPIEVGDIIVGEEDKGYMLRVLSLEPQGGQTLVVGEPAPMVDVFVQGAVGAHFFADGSVVEPFSHSASKTASADPPIPDYDFDLSGQVIHDDPTLMVEIETGTFNFLPNAEVAINYNKYRGVTYLKALLDTDSLKLDMTAHAIAANHTGQFPANDADRIFWEKQYTSLTFNLSTRQNGVPVVVAAQYIIYLGTSGDGTFTGETRARMEAVYTDLLLGGIYTPGVGTENFNESSPVFSNPIIPQLPPNGGDFDWRVYVRPEVHMKLYGNPVPGSSEDLDLQAIPFVRLSAYRTSVPEDGYDYVLYGGMDSYYKMQLFHLGNTDIQEQLQPGDHERIIGGFEPDFIPPP